MDNWLEFLVPLIILAVYFFGGMFGKKGGADEVDADPRTRTAEEDAEAAERQRVQDDIRRRILERRRAAESGQGEGGSGTRETAAPVVAPPPMPHARTVEAPVEPPPRRPMNVPQPPPRPTAPVHPGRPADPQFSWSENRERSLTDELQRRREQIAETQRKADELRRSHKTDLLGEDKTRRPRQTRRGSTVASARELLASPGAARQAIILSEIMGKPVSLREGQSSLPS